jgi:hypothetical protein
LKKYLRKSAFSKRCHIKYLILFVLLIANLAYSAEKLSLPTGKISSPYEACKNVIIVGKEKYLEHKENWDRIEKTCKVKIQVSAETGLTKLDPLKEGVQYLEFAQRVASKVLENLDKSRRYAECSASCFSGALTCPPAMTEDKITVKCSERKIEIWEGLRVNSRKIRMELALSADAPGMQTVNIRNVLSVDKNKFINSTLRDFEAGTPNPIGNTNLSERELKEANRRVELDRKKLEEEYKAKGYKNHDDWMSVMMMRNFNEHQAKYRSLIYEEAPIFGVIEKPVKYEKESEPVWEDQQIAKAFKKLVSNANTTKDKLSWSLHNSKLEFSRDNGEALGRWMISLAPGIKEQNDLLFYIGMKNQVEDVLQNDPASCAVATSMESRIHNKDLQNTGISFAISFAASSLVKGGSSLLADTKTIFRIGRALTGAEASGLTGMALGAVNMGDSFRKYNTAITEATSSSGLGGENEGTALRKIESLKTARDTLITTMIFAPVDAVAGWAVSKTLYNSLSKQMAKDLPRMENLLNRAKLDPASRDKIVDSWLVAKVQAAVKSKILTNADKKALESEGARSVLESLTADIEKSNPDFFKNPNNINFFFKTAVTAIKKEAGDPSDLADKSKLLLLHFNTEAMNGSWDPAAQKGLLKVFDNAVEELRLTAKNDPATYAKFNTDPEAQKKILLNALRRSGVASEADAKTMLQCALP